MLIFIYLFHLPRIFWAILFEIILSHCAAVFCHDISCIVLYGIALHWISLHWQNWEKILIECITAISKNICIFRLWRAFWTQCFQQHVNAASSRSALSHRSGQSLTRGRDPQYGDGERRRSAEVSTVSFHFNFSHKVCLWVVNLFLEMWWLFIKIGAACVSQAARECRQIFLQGCCSGSSRQQENVTVLS